MATLDARLARLAAAQQRTAAALQVISKQLGVQFDSLLVPRGTDEPMQRVLMMEHFASNVELIASKMKGK